jgi:hypothetical protein
MDTKVKVGPAAVATTKAPTEEHETQLSTRAAVSFNADHREHRSIADFSFTNANTKFPRKEQTAKTERIMFIFNVHIWIEYNCTRLLSGNYVLKCRISTRQIKDYGFALINQFGLCQCACICIPAMEDYDHTCLRQRRDFTSSYEHS